MKRTRDMTRKQFIAALRKRGWEMLIGGYVRCDGNLNIYRFNAGDRLRDQLAYLIQTNRKHNNS